MYSPIFCALAINPPWIKSSVAMAEAMHTGLPPYVVPCDPGFHCITLSLAMNALMGMPLPRPFAVNTMSGVIPA